MLYSSDHLLLLSFSLFFIKFLEQKIQQLLPCIQYVFKQHQYVKSTFNYLIISPPPTQQNHNIYINNNNNTTVVMLPLYENHDHYKLPGGESAFKSSGLVRPGVNIEARTLEGGLITEPRRSFASPLSMYAFVATLICLI